MRLRVRLFALLLLVGVCHEAPASSPPSCEARLPPSLRAALLKEFPAYRVAAASDYLEADVEHHKLDSNGDPCPSIASADVDGDGFADFAVVIVDGSHHALLVAAQNLAVRWRISLLRDLGNEQPLRTGVDPLPAGSYANSRATDGTSSGEAQAMQVKRYLASNPGFVAGTLEAPGNAFFFTGKRWVHLQLPD